MEATMRRALRSFLVPLLLVIIPTLLAFAWGLSWAAGDFPGCSEGSDFLASFGWVVGGLLLGLLVGIVAPLILALRHTFRLAFPVVIAAGVGMLVAGDAGATIAPPLVGCSAYFTHDDGTILVLGLIIGALPTILIAGIVIGLGAVLRQPPLSSRDDP